MAGISVFLVKEIHVKASLFAEQVSQTSFFCFQFHKRNFLSCNSFADIPKDVNVMYHTRIQAERSEEDLGKEEFIINKKILDQFSENTIVLHPLPRVDEIATDIDNDNRAMFFKQAHNGMWVRMALLLKVFEKENNKR